MNRLLKPALAGLLLAVVPSGPFAGAVAVPAIGAPDFRYYDVDARGRDLLAAINHATPIRDEGRVFHAYTRWVVEWRLHWQEGILGDCRVTSAEVGVNGSITLPRLAAGDAEQERLFGRYIGALRQHELGHYVNGRLAAMAVAQRLEALEPEADCDRLRHQADAAARAIVGYYQKRDREYDRETVHGLTQGAAL